MNNPLLKILFFLLTFIMLILGIDLGIVLLELLSQSLENLPNWLFLTLIKLAQAGLTLASCYTVYFLVTCLYQGWTSLRAGQTPHLKLLDSLRFLWIIYGGIFCFFFVPVSSLQGWMIFSVLFLFSAIAFGVIFAVYALTLESAKF